MFQITLVSMLAAVALARPEADPYFYHHGVVGHVHPTCEHGVDTLEVQTCAPRVEKDCTSRNFSSSMACFVLSTVSFILTI